MEPTREQRFAFRRMAGARRWVYNWALRKWKEHYHVYGKSIPSKKLYSDLTALKKLDETSWLKEIDSQVLQQAIRDLCRSFKNFFEKRSRYPRFKSRKRDVSRFRIPQRVKLSEGAVYVPKVGFVRIRQSRDVEGKLKGATFKMDARGHWYVCLVTEFEMPDVTVPFSEDDDVIGIDAGLRDIIVTSDGEKIAAPKFFRKAERKLRQAQRIFSRRQARSERKAKAKAQVCAVHRKIANRRKDFLHKLTTLLINDHDGVCIEDLNIKGLARTKLAKSFMDASIGEFRRQLKYKARWNLKHFAMVDRFFPSSKMCSECGRLNDDLARSDYSWTCVCGAIHDRDENAAINIMPPPGSRRV
jgi:putative transposase